MMAQRRTTVVLEVDAEKASELVSALSKRDYIRVLDLSRDGKKHLKVCPCCGHNFPRETTHTITFEIVEALVRVVAAMKVSKSVILVNKNNPISRLPEYERPRCVEMSHRLIERAIELGLLQEFKEGSRQTYFATEAALRFLGGKEPLSPSTVVVCQGNILERSGSSMVDEVKFKDRIRHDRCILAAKKAVAELPKAVVDFVENGQISLM